MLSCRLAWLTMTPLGSLVDPEVYWSSATVPPSISGSVQVSASPSSRSSATTTGSAVPSCSVAQSRTSGNDSVSVRTVRMPAFLTMLRSRCRWCRYWPGTGTGTATAPAYRQPKNEAAKAVAEAKGSRIRSPGVHRAARRLPILRASASSPAYVRVWTLASSSGSPTKRSASRSGVAAALVRRASTRWAARLRSSMAGTSSSLSLGGIRRSTGPGALRNGGRDSPLLAAAAAEIPHAQHDSRAHQSAGAGARNRRSP
ncbi:hypothetical protein SBADM41S_03955 [Streptomyces badius]